MRGGNWVSKETAWQSQAYLQPDLRTAPSLAWDGALDRVVGCLRDARGVEAVLLEDVRGLALRQEAVWQREGAHPAGQSVGGERFQHRAAETSSAHVVLDRHHDRMPLGPIDDPWIDGLDPPRVDDRALDALKGQALGRLGRDLNHPADRKNRRVGALATLFPTTDRQRLHR